MADRFYSAEEAAAVLGLQVRTVRGYIRDGRLRAVRIGKQYRISDSDLQRFTSGDAPSLDQNSTAVSMQQNRGLTSDLSLGGRRQGQPFISDIGGFAVVDICDVTTDRLDMIRRTIRVAMAQERQPDPRFSSGSLNYAYDPGRAQVRIMAYGTPTYIIAVMELIEALVASSGP